MNPREQALKSQIRKAQALIAQFEDGTGRHNSNLAAAGRDAFSRINLDPSGFDEARQRYLRAVATDWEFRFGHAVKPQDELEAYLFERGLLRAKPRDCNVGQIVRLEEIDCDGPWARARGDQEQEICDESGFVREVLINVFEFERTRYHHRGIEREFWKRVA